MRVNGHVARPELYDAADVDGSRAPPSRESRAVHVYGAPPRIMSKKVIQPMKAMSKAKPAT